MNQYLKTAYIINTVKIAFYFSWVNSKFEGPTFRSLVTRDNLILLPDCTLKAVASSTCTATYWLNITMFRSARPVAFGTHCNTFFGATAPPPTQWTRASTFTRFLDHTQRRTTVGRTPLDEWSASRRDLYLTTHNIHDRHPWPRWDSNPQSQQASGRRSTS